jgi:hypothetical protein
LKLSWFSHIPDTLKSGEQALLVDVKPDLESHGMFITVPITSITSFPSFQTKRQLIAWYRSTLEPHLSAGDDLPDYWDEDCWSTLKVFSIAKNGSGNFNTPQIYKFIRNVSEYVKCSLPEQFKLSWGGDVGISEALEPGWKISP